MTEEYTNLNLILTYKCNFLCSHCINNAGPDREECMTEEQAKHYIDIVVNTLKIGHIGYSGGEPFLEYGMLKSLIGYTFDKYNIPAGVVTNCSWAVDEETAGKKLAELYDYGLRIMVVSCDDFHLEYVPVEKIKNAVLQAAKLGIEVTINTVVYKKGTICKDDIPDLLEIPQERLGKSIHVKEFGPLLIGRARKEIPREAIIETDKKEFFDGNCPFIIWRPTILPDGSVFACCCSGNIDENPVKQIGYSGNINKTEFKVIFENMRNNLLFNLISEHGPYSVLQLIKEIWPDISVRNRFLCNCDICVELYNNEPVREALSTLLKKMTKEEMGEIYYE